MNKLMVSTAVIMFSLSMSSTVFAGENGFANSGNINACLNSGAGNGGESTLSCSSGGNEIGGNDPGNSAGHNNAPPAPPSKPILCGPPCGEGSL
jgi:hypothetical protein